MKHASGKARCGVARLGATDDGSKNRACADPSSTAEASPAPAGCRLRNAVSGATRSWTGSNAF